MDSEEEKKAIKSNKYWNGDVTNKYKKKIYYNCHGK